MMSFARKDHVVRRPGFTEEQTAFALKQQELGMPEAFNGRLRQECLSPYWFLSLADARSKIEAWRQGYDETRPHGALG